MWSEAMKTMLTLLCLAGLLAGCNEDPTGPSHASTLPLDEACSPSAVDETGCAPQSGRVTRVLDGDTIELDVACAQQAECGPASQCTEGLCDPKPKVRMLTIDTPEVSGPDFMALEAKALAEALLPEGTEVTLKYDPISGCTDRYDRRLAYVWVGDTLVQERLLQHGRACIYWFSNKPQRQSLACYSRVTAAEDRGREARVGIWCGLQPETCDR
jgi:micrococcal nuclease